MIRFVIPESELGLDPVEVAGHVRLARAEDGGEPYAVDVITPQGMLPAVAASGNQVALAWLAGDSVRVLRGTGLGAPG